MREIFAFDEIRPDEYSEAVEAKELGRLLIDSVAEHSHLVDASIGYAFRDDEQSRHGKVIVAECILTERILPSGGWARRFVKWSIQHRLFSGNLPDFVVLIDRNIWNGFDPDEKLALVDHELTHADQARDENGSPKFHKDGSPVWSVRAHDVEEFHGVVERRGLWSEELRTMARVIVDRLADEATSVA